MSAARYQLKSITWLSVVIAADVATVATCALPGESVWKLPELEDKAQLHAPSIDDESFSTPAPSPAQRQGIRGNSSTRRLCDARTTAEKVSFFGDCARRALWIGRR
jgi:hypothetical protein